MMPRTSHSRPSISSLAKYSVEVELTPMLLERSAKRVYTQKTLRSPASVNYELPNSFNRFSGATARTWLILESR